jgi:hypothetical protein
MYHEWAFGTGRPTWPALNVQHSVEQATTMLAAGRQQLGDDLVLADEQLDQTDFYRTIRGECRGASDASGVCWVRDNACDSTSM